MAEYSQSYEFDVDIDNVVSTAFGSHPQSYDGFDAKLQQEAFSANAAQLGSYSYDYQATQQTSLPTSPQNTFAFGNYSNVVPEHQYSVEYMRHLDKLNQTMLDVKHQGVMTSFEDEPPLLEELGINPDHILQKTLSVINPMRITDASILQEIDLAGPLVLCIAFGSFLIFSGKLHFGYIYSIAVIGCILMYLLLNLMSNTGAGLGTVFTVLGYCLLPVVVLSGISVLTSLKGFFGILLTVAAVLWSSLSASGLFVTALCLYDQQSLVAYPCALLYGLFALMAVF